MKPVSEAIRAALLWDVPTLRKIGSPGAQAFIDAFNLTSHHDGEGLDEGAVDDVLFTAALGVQAFVNQDNQTASEYFSELADEETNRLLGLALLAFIGEKDALERAHREAEELPSGAFRSHYLCKLAAYALDHGNVGVAGVILRDAERGLRRSSALAYAIGIAGVNLFLWNPSRLSHNVRQRSRLVDLPWIADLADTAARTHLVQVVTTRARSPWTTSLSWGLGPLERTLAAQLQAAWAGALWILPGLRLQLAAHMLADPEAKRRDSAFAMAMWALGGGKDIQSVAGLAEPGFSNGSADSLLNDQLLLGDRLTQRAPFFELAIAYWDQISEKTALSILDKYKPDPEDSPRAEYVRRLWCLLAVHAPKEWGKRTKSLDAETRVALAGEMNPGIAPYLTREAQRSIFKAIKPVVSRRQTLPIQSIVTFASIAEQLSEDISLELSNYPIAPPAAVQLAFQHETLRNERWVRVAAQQLIEQCQTEIEGGRLGKRSLFAFNPFNLLGLLASVMNRPPRQATGLLIDGAVDDSIPSDIRLDCVVAAHSLASAGRLRPSDYRRLQLAPKGLKPSLLGDFGEDVLEAAIARVLAHSKSVTPNIGAVVTSSRSTDERVRELTASSLAPLSKRLPPATVDLLLLASLFDPSERVRVSGIHALSVITPTEQVMESVLGRLNVLYSTGATGVRFACVKAASDLIGKIGKSPELVAIIASSRDDRSWRVRNALDT